MKSEKGASLIILTIIAVALIIAIVWGAIYIKNKADEENVADIHAHVLSIRALTTNVSNKHMVDETVPLLGTKLDINNNETGYKVSDEFKNELSKIENSDLYIITQDDVNQNGLSQIRINEEEFYVVDYNSGKVYYSLGLEGSFVVEDQPEKKVEEDNNVVENAENEGA